MKNIDFLPARYREQSAQRRVQLWRITLLVLFVGGVGATAACQFSFRCAARRQLAAISEAYAAARAKADQHTLLREQLAEAQSAAELYAYLEHPWPRTQILGELAARLPDALTLDEVRLTHEPLAAESNEARRARRARGRETADEERAGAEKLPPAIRDLQRLRQEQDNTRVLVEITGRTHDLGALHSYVARLGEFPLFSRCEVATVEALAERNVSLGSANPSRFKVRLSVKPGYGQAGGPSAPPGRESMAVARERHLGGQP